MASTSCDSTVGGERDTRRAPEEECAQGPLQGGHRAHLTSAEPRRAALSRSPGGTSVDLPAPLGVLRQQGDLARDQVQAGLPGRIPPAVPGQGELAPADPAAWLARQMDRRGHLCRSPLGPRPTPASIDALDTRSAPPARAATRGAASDASSPARQACTGLLISGARATQPRVLPGGPRWRSGALSCDERYRDERLAVLLEDLAHVEDASAGVCLREQVLAETQCSDQSFV